jgi:hypothetical protein
MDRGVAAWEIRTTEIGMAPPGSKEPGGFVFWLRYTQRPYKWLKFYRRQQI